ncbi:methyl-accepting chemotaxis protein [Undibacterium sp. TJN25]|uniref:methyl-accepting chemotaxis protein n=1 Tax=Undibacterium sp. TJN25 TaxID=3413056 RepID=UPI003BF16FBD
MDFSNWNVRTRLAVGFGFMLVLLLTLAAVSGYQIRKTASETEQVLKNELRSERNINEWQTLIEVSLQRALAAGKSDDPNVQKYFEDAIIAGSAHATDLQKQVLESLSDDAAKKLYQEAIKLRIVYQDARKQAFMQKQYGDESEASRFFDNELTGYATAYSNAVTKLREYQQQRINKMAGAVEQRSKTTVDLVSGTALLALVAAVSIAFLITRSILLQLGAEPTYAVEVTSAIANGDLSQNILIKTDDHTSLLHSIATMRDNLANIVSDVRRGTDRVLHSATEISDGAQDLSSRTEQQASSLEETASSMEELTATVRQNGDHARQADLLVQQASDVATTGGSAVTKVINTMDGIASSSRRMSDIIGVIDGIAFQTNILALNAAVEAARAGEEGRGFAVVATEVRGLAQRAANAAREIKELISASVLLTTSGTEMADSAGDTMKMVVQSVQSVSDRITEVAKASVEQETGIEQITIAVSQMDTFTQQNAALVEQAAAAAESLKEEAKWLSQLVSKFKLGDTGSHAESQRIFAVSPISVSEHSPAPFPVPRGNARASKNLKGMKLNNL